MALEIRHRCPLPNGLHARPAAFLSAFARQFDASITLVNEKSGKRADAKSPLSAITLDLRFEDPYCVVMEGDDAAIAEKAMSRFLVEEFGNCDSALPAVDVDISALPLSPMLSDSGAEFHRGSPVVGGIGEGRLVDLHREVTLPSSANESPQDLERECRRADGVVDRVVGWFEAQTLAGRSGLERDVIAAQRSILEDDQFRFQIENIIRRDRCSAGIAIQTTASDLGDLLLATNNPLLASRADDIDDICRRLLVDLYGKQVISELPALDERSVVVADTLLASELLSLNFKNLKGLVLGKTSATAHVVIVARSRGIPTLIDVEAGRLRSAIGRQVIVDGESGVVVTAGLARCSAYYDLERTRIRQRVEFERVRNASTGCGDSRVEMMANASSIEDVERAMQADAAGIGLLRTELLFGEWNRAPTEDEQYDTYRRAVEAANGMPVTIRLFDCGGDKPLAFMPVPAESNPFLGWRGVRMYDAYSDIIDGQIRAILRARAHGDVRPLVPMVANVEEIAGVRRRVEKLEASLRSDDDSPGEAIQVGVMIEVPAAIWIIDQLAEHADFFSVGTNDLAQYFAAADRENARVAPIANVFAPAFLRVLRQIAASAERAERRLAMCGEMAGEPSATPLLLAMGFDALSMSVDSVGRVRSKSFGLDETKCLELLDRVVDASSAESVRVALARFDGSFAVRSLFEKSLVLFDVECSSRAEVIKRLVDCLHATGRTEMPLALEQAIWVRERTSATGLGFGCAVPHCKSDHVVANSIVVARLRNPINWDGEDDTPTGFAFLLAVRESAAATEYMNVLKTLAVRIMDEQFREALSGAQDADALYEVISSSLGELPAMAARD